MKTEARHEKLKFDLGRIRDPRNVTGCREPIWSGVNDSCIGYDHRGPMRGTLRTGIWLIVVIYRFHDGHEKC